MPKFVTFVRNTASHSHSVAYISIQRSGQIAFNFRAYQMLDTAEAVELLYAPDETIVGFRKQPVQTPGVFEFRKHPNGRSYILQAASFCRFFGLDITESRRYVAQRYEDVIGIEITQPAAVTTREGRGGGRPRKKAITVTRDDYHVPGAG
jgi:hypothetical protein